MRYYPPTVTVLDNEAVQAAADPSHPKHRKLLALVKGAASRNARRPDGVRLVTPTIVRVEAGLDRRSRTATGLGVLRVHDEPLDSERADRAVALRAAVGGSPVDATVAQLAEERSEFARVLVLTSDFTDLPALVGATYRPKAIAVLRF